MKARPQVASSVDGHWPALEDHPTQGDAGCVRQAFSFDAFVEETGLGRGYISELERGLVVPSITALGKLAAALEVTVADLVLGDSPREQLFDLSRRLDDKSVAALLKQAQTLVPTP